MSSQPERPRVERITTTRRVTTRWGDEFPPGYVPVSPAQARIAAAEEASRARKQARIQQRGYTDHPAAGTVLILGILGVLVPVLPIIAVAYGAAVLPEARQRGQWHGKIVSGFILGVAFTLIQAASLVALIIMFGYGFKYR